MEHNGSSSPAKKPKIDNDNCCSHYPADLYEKFSGNPVLSRPQPLEEPPRCDDCRPSVRKKSRRTAEEETKVLWSCLECSRNFCGGPMPLSLCHAKRHQEAEKHNVAVRCDRPLIAWCHKCHDMMKIKVTGRNNMEMHPLTCVSNLVSESGNVCSDNSLVTSSLRPLMQNFLKIVELEQYFFSLRGTDSPVALKLKKFVGETDAPSGETIDAEAFTNLMDSLRTEVRQLEPKHKNNHDWFAYFLVGLHCSNDNAQELLASVQLKVDLVYNTFSVQFFSTVSYQNCGHTVSFCEQFLVLPLEMPFKEPPRNGDEVYSAAATTNGLNGGVEDYDADIFAGLGDILDRRGMEILQLVLDEEKGTRSKHIEVVTIGDCLKLFVKKQELSHCGLCSEGRIASPEGPDNLKGDGGVSQSLESSVCCISEQNGSPDAIVKDEKIPDLDLNRSPSDHQSSSLQEDLVQIHDDSPASLKSDVFDESDLAAISESAHGKAETNDLCSTSKADNSTEANGHLDNGSSMSTPSNLSQSALTERLIIDDPPPILIIQFSRSSVNSHDHVCFGEYLDLQPYMHPRFGKKDRTLYCLIGILVMELAAENEKNYTAYVCWKGKKGKGSERTWFRISKDDVRRVNLTQVLQSAAYILFYERRVRRTKPNNTIHIL